MTGVEWFLKWIVTGLGWSRIVTGVRMSLEWIVTGVGWSLERILTGVG